MDYTVYRKHSPFLTFSAGPRGCPGKHLGIAMLRVALAKIVERVELSRPRCGGGSEGHDAVRVPKFVNWMVDGIALRVTPRFRSAAL